jgi:hypothetical protein
MKCQIKVIKQVVDIFVKYQPKVGQIYDAELSPAQNWKDGWQHKKEFCIIDILDKKIVLRNGEYEIVRLCNG